MLKWEERNRLQRHQKSVVQAKSSVVNHNGAASSRSRLKMAQKPPLKDPFSKILELFHLKHYQQLLVGCQFMQRIAVEQNCTALIQQLSKQIAPQDEDRFLSFTHTLTLMAQQVSSAQEKQQKSMSKNRITAHNFQTPAQSKSRSRPAQQLTPITTATRQSFQSRVALKKLKRDSQPTDQNQRASRQPIKSLATSKATKPAQSPYNRPNVRAQSRRRPKRAKDDCSFVHDPVTNVAVPIEKVNSVVSKLAARIKHINEGHNSAVNVELNMEEVHNLYLSYDSGTLTSNLNNLDTEELLDCFAIEFMGYFAVDENSTLQDLVRQSILISQVQFQRQHQIDQSEKEEQQQTKQISVEQRQASAVGSPFQGIQSDSSEEEETQLYNSDFLSTSWNVSMLPVNCVFSQFDSLDRLEPPTREDVKNFLRLLVTSCQLEKETPIIAFVYLGKLLKLSSQGDDINDAKARHATTRNWRNILLACFVSASKMWDDKSYENSAFSRALQQFSTLEINRLERVFLKLIDYQLKVTQQEYCRSYFRLRQHAREAAKTANLTPLTLQTIRRLTLSTTNKENQLKTRHQKLVRKSF